MPSSAHSDFVKGRLTNVSYIYIYIYAQQRWDLGHFHYLIRSTFCKDVKSQIPDSATAYAFSKFFTQKVESVRSATENAAPPSFSHCPKPCCFDTFQPFQIFDSD